MNEPIETNRRQALQSAIGMAAGALVANLCGGLPAASAAAPAETDSGRASKPQPGKPGDFDFLAGEWQISHRRLKTAGSDDWDEFVGEATCWTILGGVGSVEELRIPARNFSGMGLRLLDVQAQIWSDFWVNAKSGVLGTPGTTGHFDNGVGTFAADDVDAGQPIKVRGVWDRITPKSCRWHQAVSRDGGQSWEPNWFMDWVRR